MENGNNSNQTQSTTARQAMHGLMKEIRRLRIQLYQARTLDYSDQRRAYLRREISLLKLQMDGPAVDIRYPG